MTIQEFQAWLEGFNEAIDGAPTPAQWEKIKEKVATLESVRLKDLVDSLKPTPLPDWIKNNRPWQERWESNLSSPLIEPTYTTGTALSPAN